MNERISRQELNKTEEKVRNIRVILLTTKEQLRQLNRDRLILILSHLGSSIDSPLTPWAEEIQKYAELRRADPAWLYGQLEKAAMKIKGSNLRDYPSWEPTSGQSAQAYTDEALAIIGYEGYGCDAFYWCVLERLKLAEQISKTKEENQPTDPAKRPSILYGWMRENLGILYKIHSDDWWEHY